MNRVRYWIREIHRRSVWQVLSVYAVGSWGALQVVEGITENAGLPDWVPPFALVLLVVGLPIVLATAVVQEGLPAREDDDAPPPARPTVPNLARGTGSLDVPSTRGSFLERHLTWRRAVFGGMGAFSLLGIAIGGYFFMRSAGIGPVASLVAQGVLDERDPVVLAEFENTTGDQALGELVTEALRVDLLASPVLTVVEPAYVEQVLRRMERDPAAEPLTAAVAREVAIREGLKAVIEGEVGAVGSGYLLNARILSADDGSILAAFRRTAADEAGLLDAIDGLSQDIREKAGESLRSIKQGEALGTVTTSSLDALRLYTRATRVADRGDTERAIDLMEDAVAADSTFAMAWRKLSALRGNARRPEEERDSAAARAYRFRDRLTDRERYSTEAYYHQQVTGDLEEAERAYRTVLEQYPDDRIALNNLSLIYSGRGEHERALELLDRAVGGPGESNLAHSNRVSFLAAVRRYEDARAAVERYAERYPEDPRVEHGRAQVLYRLHRPAEGLESVLAALEGDVSPGDRFNLTHWAARFDMMAGRLDEAEAHFRALVEIDTTQVQHAVGDLSRMDAVVRRDADRAVAWLERAGAEEPFRRYAPEDLASRMVMALGISGRADLARPALERSLADTPDDVPQRSLDAFEQEMRGYIARSTGRWGEAVEHFRESRRLRECEDCLLAEEGLALAAAGRADEAIDALSAWLEGPDGSNNRALYDPAALEALGGLYEEKADTAAALDAWRRFAELWKDADPVLQPRVSHARERIAALGG